MGHEEQEIREHFQDVPAGIAAELVETFETVKAERQGRWSDFTLELVQIVIDAGNNHRSEHVGGHDDPALHAVADKAFWAAVRELEKDWDQNVVKASEFLQQVDALRLERARMDTSLN
jgi:hypothetical protein